MPNVKNTVYPPQVPTFAKAFIYNQDVRIPCGISPYNNVADIKCVHLTATNQLNNENALNNAWGMLFLDLNVDDKGNSWVTLPASAMKNSKFNINQFYKIQLRFDQKFTASDWNSLTMGDGSSSLNAARITDRLLTNQTEFSEWSTVCLVRAILRPEIILTGFQGNQPPTYNKGIIPITGKLFFMTGTGEASQEETETLQSYTIQVLSPDSKDPILTTETIYTGNNIDPNDINYKIDLQGKTIPGGNDLTLRINYTTKNQYSGTQDFAFTIADYLEEPSFNPKLLAEVDDENARITLHIKNEETVFGTLYVKRGSSLDNFTNWETIRVEHIEDPIDLTIVDDTVGSMVWYRYSVQLENTKHALTQIYSTKTLFPEFYDAVFTRDGITLKVKYNFQISNLKPVVNRTKIDTLGGRYPKFAENAVLNYKQFSISGLISSEGDAHQIFLNKTKYFGREGKARYDTYVQGYRNTMVDYDTYENGIDLDKKVVETVRNDIGHYATEDIFDKNFSYVKTTTSDWLWEREFREEAVKWLNDGEPKLYRSMTEGTMAVMLTDISLTPNADLGRRLYNFSATVYEIADGNSMDTLDSLGIYPVLTPSEDEEFGTGPDAGAHKTSKPQGKKDFIIQDRNSIFSLLQEELEARYGGVLADKSPGDIALRNLKIQFKSPPHMYYLNSDQTLTEVASTSSSANSNTITGKDPNRMQLGYIVNITTSASTAQSSIFIGEKGYYQVPNHITVTGLSFLNVGDEVHLEYVMDYNERNDSSTTVSNASVEKTLLGQEKNIFPAGQYLGERIRRKYNFVKTGEFSQGMKNWMGINVDVPPFTVVSICYFRETSYTDYLVGSTGILNLLKDVPIQDMCFKGRRMTQTTLDRAPYLDPYEFAVDDTPYDSTLDVKKPVHNVVYNIDDKYKIYYTNGNWYDFDLALNGTGLAKVPTEGLINYTGQVLRVAY